MGLVIDTTGIVILSIWAAWMVFVGLFILYKQTLIIQTALSTSYKFYFKISTFIKNKYIRYKASTYKLLSTKKTKPIQIIPLKFNNKVNDKFELSSYNSNSDEITLPPYKEEQATFSSFPPMYESSEQ